MSVKRYSSLRVVGMRCVLSAALHSARISSSLRGATCQDAALPVACNSHSSTMRTSCGEEDKLR